MEKETFETRLRERMELAKHLSGGRTFLAEGVVQELQRRLKELEKKEQEIEAWEVGSETRGRGRGWILLGGNLSRGTALSGEGTQPDYSLK